ncbi:hypothetical protein ACFP1I_01030 [Dyadobacter subterraneus]|uniref:Uncharacterized protein n=1 Tax=Dyadobacter subterraneus TaxID=2773304 RepID=A0ABR9W791_9BACT|nr:hypothetical protein [Dyadobacter subterraneus]MBE9461336.1 hypothetical protein [Dyadobacter subterraneus]
MKTFQLTIITEKDANKVLNVLNGLVVAGMINITENVENAVSPNFDQVEELIDESELSPYYSEEQIKDILHL